MSDEGSTDVGGVRRSGRSSSGGTSSGSSSARGAASESEPSDMTVDQRHALHTKKIDHAVRSAWHDFAIGIAMLGVADSPVVQRSHMPGNALFASAALDITYQLHSFHLMTAGADPGQFETMLHNYGVQFDRVVDRLYSKRLPGDRDSTLEELGTTPYERPVFTVNPEYGYQTLVTRLYDRADDLVALIAPLQLVAENSDMRDDRKDRFSVKKYVYAMTHKLLVYHGTLRLGMFDAAHNRYQELILLTDDFARTVVRVFIESTKLRGGDPLESFEASYQLYMSYTLVRPVPRRTLHRKAKPKKAPELPAELEKPPAAKPVPSWSEKPVPPTSIPVKPLPPMTAPPPQQQRTQTTK